MAELGSQSFRQLLLTYLLPQWRRTAMLGGLVLFGTLLQLGIPMILATFIDAIRKGSPVGALVVMAGAFLCAGILNQAVATGATWLGAHVGWRATNMLRADLAAHCIRLDMSFHNERTPGELIERIDGDVTALANFFSQFVVRIASAMLLVIGVLILLFVKDWRAGMVLSLYVSVAALILYRLKDLAVASSELERQVNAELYGFVEERLSGIDDIRANGAGAYVVNRFVRVLRRVYARGRKAWMMRARLWLVTVGLFAGGDVLSLAMGVYLFGLGAITMGTVYLFYQYMHLVWGVVEQVTHQMQDLQKAGAGLTRIEELRRVQPIMRDGPGDRIPAGPLSLEFERVSFAYGSEAVLNNVGFSLRPGESLGLLGRTGSGKTTLTRMIFRLYDASAGTIRLGGVDVRNARIGELRQRVAMVTQEVQLFHATVRDNLTFFDPEITDDRILSVITELGIGEWFERMPEGLDTEITAGGGGLSAGEAQLLAFTRVFLRDPGLVVLDEPSSRLDLATERLLERAMRRLMKDRTTIIIAHRLSTVRRADRIMILEAGRIIEEGPRHDLARDRTSRFHRLLSAGGTGLHDGAVAAAALITLDDDGLPDIDLDEVEVRNGH